MGKNSLYTRYDDVEVKCPYYKGSNDIKISCEGITDECVISLTFFSKKKRNEQKQVFCDNKYCNCEVYRMLEQKYEE